MEPDREVPLLVRPIAALEGLRPYATEPVPQPVDLRLDGNEGVHPPESVFDAARAAGVESVRTYPSAAELERALAVRLGCDASMVLATAGADDGLDRACRAVLGPGRELVTVVPTFEMIPRSARLTGATVREVPWWQGDFPLEQIAGAVSERTGAIAVVSPNNPTGLVATRADVTALARRFPQCLIMLDGAYEEFAGEALTPLAFEHSNVVGFRTMSKAWGLAGLRVGYCFGDPRVVRWLRTTGGPYAISGPSIAMAIERLGAPQDGTSAYVANVARERDLLTENLERRGVGCQRSQGNFVLARFDRGGARDDRWTRDALASLGILTRRFGSRAELAGTLRITCPGEPGAFARLSAGLDAALAPEAILFDLDGVLADVSRSYRRAIVETCATFGVRVTPEDIAQAKAEGNANNDWILSQRLLLRAGVDRPLEEVTRVFEGVYQGTEAAPGLRSTETLLCAAPVLQRLATRLPLAIVTGRPRNDAMRFLSEHKILPLFRTVICMEDATIKPAPDPALKALRRLGVRSAWMIGDTVDDVRCARGAGVVSLGIVQPGEAGDPESKARTARTLLEAGAARVLESVDQIEELLS